MSGSTRLTANQMSHHVAILFFGGPDDREALSYAWRMSDHPGISLTVLRFVSSEDAAEGGNGGNNFGMLSVETDVEREKQMDESFISDFRMRYANDDSVAYIEKVVNNGEETVAAIRSMDDIHDLFIVGRGQGTTSPLTAGLTDWSECPELGVIGDLLASSDFAATASVLVVQQYVGTGSAGDHGLGTPDNTVQSNEEYMQQIGCISNAPPPRPQNNSVFSPQRL